MISKEQREQDKAICEAATPGEWIATTTPYAERPGTYEVCDLVNDLWIVTSHDGLSRPEDDAAFIALARTALPVYIADADEMERRIATLAGLVCALDAGEVHVEGVEHVPEGMRYAVTAGTIGGLRMAIAILRGEP